MLEHYLGELLGTIKTYNTELATSSTTTAIKAVILSNEILMVMTIAIRDVGDRFVIYAGRVGI